VGLAGIHINAAACFHSNFDASEWKRPKKKKPGTRGDGAGR